MQEVTQAKTHQYWTNDDGDFHREHGPAIIYRNGTECWYLNGKLHRITGPAIITPHGYRWYIHGKEYTETEFNFWKHVNG